MPRRYKLFLSVLGISFAGSLPPGVLNTGVAGLVATTGPAAAAWFGLGAILMEMTIVRIAHAGIVRWSAPGRFPRWLSIGLSMVLLLVALLYSGKTAGVARYAHYPLLGGMLLSTLNPLHLPFWLGWTAVLRTRNLLANASIEYHLFSVAIGAGTALAFLVYGFAGQLILQWLHHGQ